MDSKGVRLKKLKLNLKEKIENCYLFEGDDYELYSRGLSMILRASGITLEDFNLVKFDDENYSMNVLLSACEVMPMGSPYRVVILKNVEKISENDKKMLQNYVKSPTESTILIILDYFNKFSSLKNNVYFVDCNRFDKTTLSSVVVSELNKRNKKISAEALDTLIDYCNGYLSRIVCELDKLAYYDVDEPLITKKLVDNMVTKDNEVVIFELTEALGQRKADKALNILEALKKEMGILGLIINHFRRLFFISISDLPDKELASLLNVKEFAISKQRGQVKNFSKMQLKKIYSLLEEVDYAIKSGAMLQENALNYLVLSILYI